MGSTPSLSPSQPTRDDEPWDKRRVSPKVFVGDRPFSERDHSHDRKKPPRGSSPYPGFVRDRNPDSRRRGWGTVSGVWRLGTRNGRTYPYTVGRTSPLCSLGGVGSPEDGPGVDGGAPDGHGGVGWGSVGRDLDVRSTSYVGSGFPEIGRFPRRPSDVPHLYRCPPVRNLNATPKSWTTPVKGPRSPNRGLYTQVGNSRPYPGSQRSTNVCTPFSSGLSTDNHLTGVWSVPGGAPFLNPSSSVVRDGASPGLFRSGTFLGSPRVLLPGTPLVVPRTSRRTDWSRVPTRASDRCPRGPPRVRSRTHSPTVTPPTLSDLRSATEPPRGPDTGNPSTSQIVHVQTLHI